MLAYMPSCIAVLSCWYKESCEDFPLVVEPNTNQFLFSSSFLFITMFCLLTSYENIWSISLLCRAVMCSFNLYFHHIHALLQTHKMFVELHFRMAARSIHLRSEFTSTASRMSWRSRRFTRELFFCVFKGRQRRRALLRAEKSNLNDWKPMTSWGGF